MAEFNNVKIISFDDACVCISQLLSMKDRLIYLVVSATLGHFVVPLIHNYRCIQHIYIYQDDDNKELIDWRKDYPKIRENTFSIDRIVKKIKEDIDSIMERPCCWSRSKALLRKLCLQISRTDISLSIKETIKNDLNMWRIVVLYLDLHKPFHLFHPNVKINEFNNIEECIYSIEIEETSVFLIISMNKLSDVRSVAELKAIHAVYIVSDIESKEQFQTLSTYSKLSGVFVPDEDLLEQLTADICFYRHVQLYTPIINVFKTESNILENLTEPQIDFLSFQLFSCILLQLPISSTTSGNSNMENTNQLLCRLIEANMQIGCLFDKFDISTLQRSVVELRDINQQIVSLAKNVNSSSITVYRAQLVSPKDIEMIIAKSNNLVAIRSFVLASYSYQSVAEICRRAVNNQLTVVFFEIKVTGKGFVANVNSNTVVFSLGTLFRAISIDFTPDGVWRAQLETADSTMQTIKDQLRVEIGGHLTWLTFGNYMAALKRFSAAENYYKYLLQVLSPEHVDLALIYNNLGLVYSEMNDNKRALKSLKKALELNVSGSPIPVEQKPLLIADLSSPPYISIDRISILTKMAEITCRLGRRESSLEYYRQALQIATDARSRQFYDAKIAALLVLDDNFKT